jgi:hypothetical protein
MLNLPNNGYWTQVILNMHPDHRRGDGGGVDLGVQAYPTEIGGINGGDDPLSTYNYFDTMTRIYIQDDLATGSFLMDDFQFYNEPVQENDKQVFSVTSTYNPTNNELILTWNRFKDDNSINEDVRYAFSDIHQIGWNAATPAPNGIITPPGWQGYNGMVYDNSTLPLAGHSEVYIAIKPENSNTFTEIAVPIYAVGQNPTPVSEIFSGSNTPSQQSSFAQTSTSAFGNAASQGGIEALAPANQATPQFPGTVDGDAGAGDVRAPNAASTQQARTLPQPPRFATRAKPVQVPQPVFQPRVIFRHIVVNDDGSIRRPVKLF